MNLQYLHNQVQRKNNCGNVQELHGSKKRKFVVYWGMGRIGWGNG